MTVQRITAWRSAKFEEKYKMNNKQKVKVGIVTIVDRGNYGNRLQNYALNYTLHFLGFDTVTFNDPIQVPHTVLYWMKQEIKRVLGVRNGHILRRHRCFEKLNNRHLQWQDYHLASDCDYVVLGSDQIWSPDFWFVREVLDFYFGTFAEPQKRIAYAASIGVDQIPKELEDKYIQELSALKSISVRETQGAQIIQNLTGRSVPVVLDPTMLLTEQAWTALEKKPNYRVKKQFLLTYFLGKLSAERQAFIQNIADKYDLQWIALDSEWVDEPQNLAHYMTTPDEFIWLVHHCQLMLTDSFHGSVFSILFDKPFRCFEREENGMEEMGSRMDTLFGKFGIDDWCRGSVKESMDHIFYKDYASVPMVLEQERQFALDYLKDALEIHE